MAAAIPAASSLPFFSPSSHHSLRLSPPFFHLKNPNPKPNHNPNPNPNLSCSPSTSSSSSFRHGRRPRRLPPALRVATPPTAPTPISKEENQETLEIEEEEKSSDSSAPSSDSFSWRDHWYPVSLIEDLDPRIPTPFQLLNREIVLWNNPNTGDWVAFDDRCPHRLAPLSEGRIDEDGCLQCSYHGWSFDGKGACTKIPQAASEGPEAWAVRSPRAGVTKLPTLVSQGLLFVWPDENGWEKASQTKPPVLPDDFSDPKFSTVTIQRDLFYGYDTLMENVSDPSHIDFAHHKVTGRRDRAKPLPFKLESGGVWGFAGSNSGNPRIIAKFVAPCYYINKIEIDTKLPFLGDQKWVIWICSFNIPMAPGKTRSIVCSARNFFQFTMPGPAWWQMLDRYEQHTLKCSSCKGAYSAFQTLQKLFIAATVVLCASSGIPSEMSLRLLVAGAAIVSAAVAFALHEFQKNFVFVDYVHAEID